MGPFWRWRLEATHSAQDSEKTGLLQSLLLPAVQAVRARRSVHLLWTLSAWQQAASMFKVKHAKIRAPLKILLGSILAVGDLLAKATRKGPDRNK